MRLCVFKTLWGHAGDIAGAVRQAQQAGFAGIEAPVALLAVDGAAAQIRSGGLDLIAEICTAGSYVPRRHATPAEHLASLADALARAKPLAPRLCTVIAGCDAWPLAVQVDFFERALALADVAGMQCSFETHRARSLFTPWTTVAILERVPQLQLTCDFSHWAVVCERLPDTEWDCIAYAAERALHLHARVGYEQGPQVPHPAAPEYAAALAAHQRCWEAIWRAQRRRGLAESTLTPEFGPDGYLQCAPFTRAPVADLWQVNCWMADTERAHFQRVIPPATESV